MPRPHVTDLRAAYSLGQLARMAGMDRRTLNRLLESNRVKMVRNRRGHRWVCLSALREQWPDFWTSVLDRTAVVQAMGER
jgi:hypothetical protein